jgi:predicted permease
MIAVLFGGPTSVSSFAMAKEMKSDPVLAGNIVILTSALCAFTYMIVISMWLSIA